MGVPVWNTIMTEYRVQEVIGNVNGKLWIRIYKTLGQALWLKKSLSYFWLLGRYLRQTSLRRTKQMCIPWVASVGMAREGMLG